MHMFGKKVVHGLSLPELTPEEKERIKFLLDEVASILPQWTEERAIYLFSGVELVIFRMRGGKWNFKISRCNLCGKCCMGLEKHSFPLVDGQCIHLKKEPGKNSPKWLCGLGMGRPFGCCVGTPSNMSECTEKYEEIE